MIKLIKIEWLKIRGNRFFWIGFGLYLLCMILLIVKAGGISLNLSNEENAADGFKSVSLGEAGLYKLPHIWHNLTYLAIWFKFIPAFIFIYFVSNEFNYKTFRQNIIDGLSIRQFYISKLLTAFNFSLLSFLIIGICIFILALAYNEGAAFTEIFAHSEYMLAYFLEVFFLMLFVLLLTLWFRRSTITIIVILLYYFIIEPLLALILNTSLGEGVGYYLPTQPSRELILQPMSRLFNVDAMLNHQSPDTLNYKFVWLSLLYSVILGFGGFAILKSRDV